MRKKITFLLFVGMALLAILPANAQTWPPIGMRGDGNSEKTAWEIGSNDDLAALAAYVNAGNGAQTDGKYYKLMKDLDLADWAETPGDTTGWKPIGDYTGSNDAEWLTRTFRGTFDGNGHLIKNMTINRPDENYIGLFGYLYHGNIKDIGIVDCDITGNNYVGGLVGYNRESTITHSYATGSVTGNDAVGGLVGFNRYSSHIGNSYATGSVTGTRNVGGLVGISQDSSLITHSYATGSVTGTGNFVGGLVGRNIFSSSVTHSYATGSVTGNDVVGGLVGYNSEATITHSYATGSVTGSNDVGGLVGTNDQSSTITHSYATGSVTGTNRVGGLVGWNFQSSITHSYATGSVNGSNDVGGLVGSDWDNATITYSYATGSVTGNDNVGGLVGENVQSTIQNCVAANDSVTAAGANAAINRIAGFDMDGTYSNNYALSSMEVEANGQTGQSGADKKITDLQSYSFYSTAGNWYNSIAWSITPPSGTPEGIWKICDGEGFPILQWQTNGDGTSCFPYLIYTVDDLAALAAYVNAGNGALTAGKHYKLMKDLDLADWAETPGAKTGWKPIGYYTANFSSAFRGTFDGNGHIIKNMSINRPNEDYIGLFGYLYQGNIKDIGIVDCDITGNSRVGGLVGENRYSTITHSYATGSVNGNDETGGLVGYHLYSSLISNSYATANVTGNNNVGGLVGFNRYSSHIGNSYATGSVNGNDYVGGLVGINVQSTITHSYATGSVTGNDVVGGLVGTNRQSSSITHSYATGSVTGNNYVGGLVGRNYQSSSITHSYATGSVTGNNYVGGLVGRNYQSTIQNCVAANDSVTAAQADAAINRIAGFDEAGTYSNNYALSSMKVEANGQTGQSGGDQSLEDMQSYLFYSTGSNWYNGIAWSITPSSGTPEGIWKICNGEGFPILQWQTNGDGTSCFPYLIYTVDDLAALAAYVNAGNGALTDGKYYKLMNNLDLKGWDNGDGKGWKPIGYYTANFSSAFQGTFDGAGHVIKNMSINRLDEDYIGLFGVVYDGNIKDIGIVDCNVTGNYYVGGLVGVSQSSSHISNSYATGSVNGTNWVGGLVGTNNQSSTITHSYATGSVNGTNWVGGLVGANYQSSTITHSYATGSVNGTGNNVGGLVGTNSGSTIQNCVAANDSVTAAEENAAINRIAGVDVDGTCRNNYALSSMKVTANNQAVTITPNLDGPSGADKELEDLQSHDFYNSIAWSITPSSGTPEGIWKICDGEGFPILQWQTNGDGTSCFPYLIYTVDDLAALAAYVNAGNGALTAGKHYKLMKDLDLEGWAETPGAKTGWKPIGDYTGSNNTEWLTRTFQGTFDGNGHLIKNMTINRPDENYIGLFGYLYHGNIKDIGIVDCDVNGNNEVGGLVGISQDSSLITHSYATGSVTGTGNNVGGLVGFNRYSSHIGNSYATGSVTGTGNFVGGLVGISQDLSLITHSYATGSVTGTGNFVGGLVGRNIFSSSITHSYATGSVTGNDVVGGLVGNNDQSTITHSYATGSVNGNLYVGGLVGYNYSSTITHSYATGSVNGTGNFVGGLVGYNSEATITHSYATGSVTGNNNVGGLVGYNILSTIQNCVAANASVTAAETTDFINRIAGYDAGGGTYSNNYALSSMEVKANNQTVTITPNLDGPSGADKELADLQSDAFYNSIAWSITPPSGTPEGIWKICDGEGFPILQWQTNGDGTSCFPYLIYTVDDLAALAAYVNAGNGAQTDGKYYKLMKDLDLADWAETPGAKTGWKPIGYYTDNFSSAFRGTFDGNGHLIKNMTINRPGEDAIGLFGTVYQGNIKDIGIVNCNVTGNEVVGGLVGINIESTITHSYATGSVTGNEVVGGLVGINIESTITHSYATGSVTGNDAVGGLVGVNQFSSHITHSYATGSVNGTGNYVGGLVGWNYYSSSITHSYATGSVNGNNYVGGLVGYNALSTIQNCVAANDSVTAAGANAVINRIAGFDDYSTYSNNYALSSMEVKANNQFIDITSNLDGPSGGDQSLIGLQSHDFYSNTENWYNSIAWSITPSSGTPEGIWKICDGEGFPFLSWQQDIICSGLQSHTITAIAGANGSIVPEGEKTVTAGDNQPFTFAANNGYEVDQLLIDGINVPDSIAGGSYTFENVTEDHTIEVTFKVVPVSNIELSGCPENGLLANGATCQLQAAVFPDNALNKTVVWRSTNPNTAIVDATGKVTARSTGVTYIIAKAQEGDAADTCHIRVVQPVTGIVLTPAQATLLLGEEKQLMAKILPENATIRDIIWNSSDETAVTVDAHGKITGIAAGEGVITATTVDGGFEAMCQVTVVNAHAPATGVTVTPKTLAIERGETYQLSAEVKPANASQMVTWSSNNPAVATVAADGTVTALAAGKATITAKTDNNYKATCAVTVTIPIDSIVVTPDEWTLPLKGAKALKATVYPSDASNKTIKWSSSNTTIATVSSTGTVTAKNTNGVVEIYATNTASGISGVCAITVGTGISAAPPMDISEENTTNHIVLYPNPTTGKVTIKSTSLVGRPGGAIKVFDMTGRLVLEMNHVDDNEVILDLSGYAAGVYFINVDGKTMKVVKK